MQKFGEDGLPINSDQEEERDDGHDNELEIVDSFASIHEKVEVSKMLCWTCAHGLARKQVQGSRQREGDEWKGEDDNAGHKFWNVICTRLQNSPNQFLTSELLACNRYQPRNDARSMLSIERARTEPSTTLIDIENDNQDFGQGALI